MLFKVTTYAGDFSLLESFETEKEALTRARLWNENGLTDVVISDDARNYIFIEFALKIVNH